MKISNVSQNTSFGKIFQVVGDKQHMKELRSLVQQEEKKTGNPTKIYDVTDIFSSMPKTKEILANKDVFYVVTGPDYEEDVRNNDSSDFLYLVSCTDKIIKLGKNIKNDAICILNAIKENI